MKELPNVRKAYQAYHEKGFEVIGISMDENRPQLDEYLNKNPMPWVTLHEGNGTVNPTAIHYGISALPSSLLVDQNGRVVSTDARGKDLELLLKKLLGPAQ
jgi:peroxiredoxin